jgi:hypothetical protein
MLLHLSALRELTRGYVSVLFAAAMRFATTTLRSTAMSPASGTRFTTVCCHCLRSATRCSRKHGGASRAGRADPDTCIRSTV